MNENQMDMQTETKKQAENTLNKSNTLGISKEQSSMVSNENVPTEVGQVAQTANQVRIKETSNWTFIIALFAFVGIFVILLPILVKILGY